MGSGASGWTAAGAGAKRATACSTLGTPQIREASTGATGSRLAEAAIQRVGRRPIAWPSAPPIAEPSGSVPQTMNRMVAFIRPWRLGGVIACRTLSWPML